ncbi:MULTISPECIES: hypothetical protein [unclassified Streptomyces]|nr:hypothetical protein [Streptomyces sp. CNQ-509]
MTWVDLNRQLLWVQQDDGLETRGGWHRIYWRSIDHYSTVGTKPGTGG